MIRIEDIMSCPVITVSPANSVQEALEIMRDHDVRRLPVMDRAKLVGMLVQHDIENALRSPGRIPETPVGWVMTKKIHSVAPGQTAAEAALIMKNHKISALPVTDSGKLVGIVTDSDLLQVLIDLYERMENG